MINHCIGPLLAGMLLLGQVAGAQEWALKGDDIEAFTALERAWLSGEPAVQAYRAFILAHPRSPYAVVLWDRLEQMGRTEDDFAATRAERQAVAAVRRAHDVSQRRLDQREGEVRLARLPVKTPSQQPSTRKTAVAGDR